ncbi:amino acid/polyamine transporter I [Thelonectria olida]|uniref:Amino acid/polyamine transporter I n=1 Tax=Thelonectria olida TaxID=1576542 RepID=A0A9P8VQI3_9HYPO|nr:amino acid/polyamine transporter I [Thelonectria olida]
MAAIDAHTTDKPCEESPRDPSVKIIDTPSEVVLVKHKLGFLNLIALGFNVCNSWAGISSSMQVALLQGGPGALLYGLFLTTSLYLSIALSMAELASVYSTAGGQYHFASILAPDRVSRGSSYICGFITMISWEVIGATVTMVASAQILALWQYYHPSFRANQWHSFVIYEAFGLFVALYNNLVLPRALWTHNFGFTLNMVVFVVVTVLLIVRPSNKAPDAFVWDTFVNFTGWPDGICFLTSLLTSSFGFTGLDACIHLAEDVSSPKKVVPRAIVLTVAIGFVTTFPFIVVLLYGISDMNAVLAIQGYLPFEMYRMIWRSDTAAIAIIVSSIVLTFCIVNAIMQTSSRMTWAFARDNGISFSCVFGKMHPTHGVPLNAAILNWVILSLCGVVFLASKIAFNALLGSMVVLQLLSYEIPLVLLLWRRRGNRFLPPNRPFRLPKTVGWIVNVYAVALGSALSAFFLLPPFLPVTSQNMNYTCAILGIGAVLCLLNWFIHARQHYNGPHIVFHE